MSSEIAVRQGLELEAMPQDWVETKRNEITEGEAAYEALKALGATKNKLARVRAKITFLRRWMAILEKGFIPLPRLDVGYFFSGQPSPGNEVPRIGTVPVFLDAMPLKALEAIKSVKEMGVFDRIAVISPRRHRDPLVVGIIQGAHQEAHFLITWYLPEVFRLSEFF